MRDGGMGRRGWRLASVALLAVTLSCARQSPLPVGSSPTASSGSPIEIPGELPAGTLVIQTETGEVKFRVQIAETGEARQRGLMNVRQLDADAGMVFLFEIPTDGAFWMKDTLIPLSIAFWDPDGRVVAILDMEPCRADPCPLYSPGAEYIAAVEVNKGVLDQHGVRVGDTVRLNRS